MHFIFTEDFKIALCAETKAWKVAFGRAMNERYCTMMDQILEQIDDINKRLCRPVKDLDDVRVAMAALKEIREQEIQMDMSIGPIEVSILMFSYTRNTYIMTGVICNAQQVSD